MTDDETRELGELYAEYRRWEERVEVARKGLQTAEARLQNCHDRLHYKLDQIRIRVEKTDD